MTGADRRDLFILVADLDAENAMKGLLARHQSLGIRPLDFRLDSDLLRFAGRDAGCRHRVVDLLRVPQGTHRHALAIFDHHGCGREDQRPETIEQELEQRLRDSGWNQRARVVVIEPELENWVWRRSEKVAQALGCGSWAQLEEILSRHGHRQEVASKPRDPKRAMQDVLRHNGMRLSARHFESLGACVGGLDACIDPAFRKLLATLRSWFPLPA